MTALLASREEVEAILRGEAIVRARRLNLEAGALAIYDGVEIRGEATFGPPVAVEDGWSYPVLSAVRKFEMPEGPLPALKLPDPEFTVARLRDNQSAGFLSRIERKERVGRPQYLVGEIETARPPARVWAVVVQRESRQFDKLEAVPVELRAGIDKYSLAEFEPVSPLFYVPIELVHAFRPPIELPRPVPGRRFGPLLELKKSVDFRSMVARVGEMSNDELAGADSDAHRVYQEQFTEDQTSLNGLTIEDLVNAHVAVVAELKRRGLAHASNDPLDRATAAWSQPPVLEHKGEYLAVHPGSTGEHPEVSLEEVVAHLRDAALLRSPAVFLVGSLCTQGKTCGDIDVLIRGPLDEATRRSIEFRIGRALPPELSQRVHFIDEDDDGGPYTDHVGLYDLALAPRGDRSVKRMGDDLGEGEATPWSRSVEVAKQSIPHMLLPARERPRPAVLQWHSRGRSLHYDFRVQVEDFLTGWTLAGATVGAISEDIESVVQARRAVAAFDVAGSAINKPLIAPSRWYAAEKAVQPTRWLRIEGEEFDEGEVGATRNEKGFMVAIARPRVSHGLQKPLAAEYFLEKDAKFSGILFVRLLSGTRPPTPEEEESGRRHRPGEPFWVAMLAKSHLPSVLKRRAVVTRSIPPKGYSALPPGLKEIVPEELRYWLADKPAERIAMRDALVRERLFTESNVRLVRGEFRRVVEKSFVHVRRDPTYFELVETEPMRVIRRYGSVPDGAGAKPRNYLVVAAMDGADEVFVVAPEGPANSTTVVRAAKKIARKVAGRAVCVYLAAPHMTLQSDGETRSIYRVTERFDADEQVDRATSSETVKQLKRVPFALAWQTFKGQVVIRAAPTREVYHLMLARSSREIEDFQFPIDPMEADRSTAIRRVLRGDAKSLLSYEGPLEPGKSVGGVVLNPTKATPSDLSLLQRGTVEFLEDRRSFKKLRFRGKPLDGIFTLVQEDVGSAFWYFERGQMPSRPIPELKEELCVEPDKQVEKQHRVESLALADGAKLADVQIWDPKDIDDDADRGGERTKLAPLALFQPMKVPPRATREFRSNELDRLFDDFATPTLLSEGILAEPKYNGWRVIFERDAHDRLFVFGEDVFRRRTELRDYLANWPHVHKELSGLPGPFVLDGEFMAWNGDAPVPRRDLAEFRGASAVDDSRVRIMLFDALYLPKYGNLTRESQLDRRRALEEFLRGHKLAHFALTPTRLERSREGLTRAYHWARKAPGSEGAMFKAVGATYSLGGETDSWAKLKAIRELYEIVYDKHPVKDSPGVWNYFGAVGPVDDEAAKSYAETVEVKGKRYVPVGKTFNSRVVAAVGDVIRVEVTEIFFDQRKPSAWRLRHFTPTVVDAISHLPTSIPQLIFMLDDGELAKSYTPVFDATSTSDRLAPERIVEKSIRLWKAEDRPEEERFVLGVVLEPEIVDSQGDIYSSEEIRRAAHHFMEFYRHVGLQHRGLIDDRVAILESYLVPADCEIGGQAVKSGTWILAARVNDLELWEKVKSGDFDGWSIGGDAIRVSETRT